jgi:hypothetical protein
VSGNRELPAGGLPRADLGAVFDVAGTDRRSRLSTALQHTANPGTDRATEPVDQDQGGVDVDQAADDVAEERPAADDQGTRQLIVYMPAALRARLRRAAIGSTQLDVMLDAVEQTESAKVLGGLVTQHQAPATDGLFARRPARGSESNVQVNVRAMHQHTAVLDRLATRYNTNRSELIRVALDHVLPGGPRRRK